MTDWPQIIETHSGLVHKTLWRLLGRESDVADCYQNAFVAAWKIANRQTVSNWPGLLKRLATTQALDRLRQRHRDADRHQPLPDDLSASSRIPTPQQAAQQSELGQHLRLALTRIPDRQAQVFCLICLDDLSYRQVADQLGVTVNNVGVLLNDARSRLRQLLEEFNPAAAVSPTLTSHDPDGIRR